ncbi:GNAT family N-acetyltransferase [Bacillus carboniphilus]|uniref:GNAT family N-acetyltransferase n=1 Tax=Bacillus carboniphilus TaxID=86663 RepID=A0ABY9JSU1_9BACI|nr:GNAT family N-acetyltransferase [Bacillus carboniphilus]WLR42417.1 GNAT family N-acetyltransferase [Bacillus carboniphilus]
MKYMIREMNENDIKQVQSVAKISWHDTYEGMIPTHIQENFLKNAYNDKSMIQRMERSHLYIAEIDQKIIGFANFSPVKEKGVVELFAIYLLPDFQGLGVGTALLDEGIKRLNGVKKIYINVEKDNQKGKNFYLSKGFKLVEEFDDPIDDYVLQTERMALIL